MPNIKTHWYNKIPEHLLGIMEYYPDVVLFEFNQIQYTHLWQQLETSSYIYTNGSEVSPTNWFMYAYQSIKGWLGFENNCQPEKVSYTLNKLAYYGYTQQFEQPDFSLPAAYSLTAEIINFSNDDYNNATTAALQTELVKAYYKVQPYLSESYRLGAHHRFGESWAGTGFTTHIPALDPQDDSLISWLISSLEERNPADVKFIKNSKFANAAAQYFCDKAKTTQPLSFFTRLLWTDPRPGYFTKALTYNPDIAKNEVQRFIEHHLHHKEYEAVVNLLGFVNGDQLVLRYMQTIPEHILHPLVQKDTPIAAVLAKHYLAKQKYQLAQQFYTNIEALHPEAAFTIAMQENTTAQAYAIFSRHASTVVFPVSACKTLAKKFFNMAEDDYEVGQTHKSRNEWQQAEDCYLTSLVHKKYAARLNPVADYLENVHIHRRLYANLLISNDLNAHKPEASDPVQIQKAILLLRECSPTTAKEQHYLRLAHATGLMRRVDYLCEKTSTSIPLSDMTRHKQQYASELALLIKTLKDLIDLLQGTKDGQLQLFLGKAHYLLADVQDFFDIHVEDMNHHYKMAMMTVPENPLYILRVTEIFDDRREELQGIGMSKLKAMGYNVFDFCHLDEERWVKKDNIIGTIKDRHDLKVIPSDSPGLSLSIGN